MTNSEIIIWTTTPCTIPANKALAFNENLKYLIIKIEDDSDFRNRQIVVAQPLLKLVLEECKIKKFNKILEFKGKDFEGTVCNHPFSKIGYDYDVPMLKARFVTT